jgi:hypothetical protein
MRFSGFIAFGLIVAAQAICGAALAQTTLYKSSCANSSMKQGAPNEDLTNAPGAPITCQGVSLSALAGNHEVVQFIVPGQSVLGFGGDVLDRKTDPKFITLPIKRLYLPSFTSNGPPSVVEGAEGFCFLDGKELNALRGILCVAQAMVNKQHVVYQVESKMEGPAQTIGGPAPSSPARPSAPKAPNPPAAKPPAAKPR